MTSECNQYELAISAFMDDELSNEELRPLFLHLANCEHCRKFWRASTNVEREILQQPTTIASEHLDERVASIGGENQSDTKVGRQKDPVAHWPMSRLFRPNASMIPKRKLIPGYAAVVFALLSCLLGIILGALEPWSSNVPDRTETQIVYVSVLPNVTVLGHVSNSNQ